VDEPFRINDELNWATKMSNSKWAGLAVIMWIPAAVHAATYELGEPFHTACEGILVSQIGIYGFDRDDPDHPATADDEADNEVCERVIVAEKNSLIALPYTLKDNEISRILNTCSVGKRCRIEGDVRNFTHDVFFFVKIDSISAN
jgi:hypothetical protein